MLQPKSCYVAVGLKVVCYGMEHARGFSSEIGIFP